MWVVFGNSQTAIMMMVSFFFFLAFSFVLVSSHLNAIKRRESLEEMIWILECGLERYLKFWLMLLHLEISKSKQAYEVAVLLGLPVPTFSSLSTQITFSSFPNSPCGIHSSMGLDFLHTDQSAWFLWPTATVSSPWFLMDGYGLDANIYGSGYFKFLYNLILWDRCCEKILRIKNKAKKKKGKRKPQLYFSHKYCIIRDSHKRIRLFWLPLGRRRNFHRQAAGSLTRTPWNFQSSPFKKARTPRKW